MALEQSYILMICGCVLSPDFLHSPYFQLLNMYFRHFFANASIFQQQIVLFCVIIFLQHIDYQYFHSFKKFANATFINASSYLLRKTATISLGFTGTKILIFRKCHIFFRFKYSCEKYSRNVLSTFLEMCWKWSNCKNPNFRKCFYAFWLSQ